MGVGSTYFRYKNLIEELSIKWCVVEQKHFIDRGKETVHEIPFYYSIDEAVREQGDNSPYATSKSSCIIPNVLLLSSVLMYLDKPYEMFETMLQKGFDYIIIDESAFFTNDDSNERIMLQHVPASIYSAVYPLHVFGLTSFREFISKHGYEILWEWTYSGGQIPIKSGFALKDTIDKGFLLKKK